MIDQPTPDTMPEAKKAFGIEAVMALTAAMTPPPLDINRNLGHLKSKPYSKRQWQAMKKRRKAAQASRRRNRR